MSFVRKTGLILSALLLAWLFSVFYARTCANWIELFVQETWSVFQGQKAPPQNIVIVSIDKESREKLKVPLRHREYFPFVIFYDDIDGSTFSSFIDIAKQGQAARVGVLASYYPQGGALINELASGALNEALSPLEVHIAIEEDFYVPPENTFPRFSFVSLPRRTTQSRHRAFNPEDPDFSGRLSFGWTARWFYGQPETGLYEKHTPFFPQLVSGVVKEKVPDADDLIRFYGPAGTFPTVSLARVLFDKSFAQSGFFKDKIVLLGHGPGYDDNFYETDFRTPGLGAPLYPVEIVATQTANIIDGSWIKRLSVKTEQNIMFVLALSILLAYFFLDAPKVGRAMLGLFVAWAGASFLAFAMGFFVPGLSLFLFVGYGGILIVAVVYLFTHPSTQGLSAELERTNGLAYPVFAKSLNAICTHFGVGLVVWEEVYNKLVKDETGAYLGCISAITKDGVEGQHLYAMFKEIPSEALEKWEKGTSLFYKMDFQGALGPMISVGSANCCLSLAAWRYVEDIAKRLPELSVEIPDDWEKKMALSDKGLRFFIPRREHELTKEAPEEGLPHWEQ